MIGEIGTNNKGTEMMIIDWRNSQDIDVEFLDGHHYIKEHTTYTNFKRGEIKNPFDPTVVDVGYIGVGEHLASVNGNRVTPVYKNWQNMINKCTLVESERNRNYRDCLVCDEWKNFQTFAEWCNKNYYDIGDERIHVDKDIKYFGNRVYSPYHCILVPQSINELFKGQSGRKKKADLDLPYTIKRCASGFGATYRGKSLGIYRELEGAINAYVKARQSWASELVNKYDNMSTEIKQIIIRSAGKRTIK